MSDILIPEIRLVDTKLIKLDSYNPNSMNSRQFEALKQNIQKFGFIVPIITNKEYLIADGQHRYLAAKELQLSQIPAIVLPLQEVDRRILRQVLNKLKGRHDKFLDNEEFKFIFESDKLSELNKLLAMETTINVDNELIQKEIDETIPTNFECPKCGYRW